MRHRLLTSSLRAGFASTSAWRATAPAAAATKIRPETVSTSSTPDPFKILAPQVKELQQNLLRLLGSSNPTLTDIASYYFLLPGKQLRPLLVLLISRATNGLASGWNKKLSAAENGPSTKEDLDRPLTSPEVLTDWNPRMPDHTASFSSVFSIPSAPIPPSIPTSQDAYQDLSWASNNPHFTILPTQTRLAQIAEMIHVASLLHDDVIDKSSLRRAAPSAPFKYGNKLAILGGDFLLGRTSAALSRLGSNEVVELIASIISNLVEGEVMQAKEVVNASNRDTELNSDLPWSATAPSSLDPALESDRWTRYLQKTYYKTASLMAKSARSAVVLGGAQPGVPNDELLKDIAYAYGRNMGIAFQIIDDALDFSTSAELGKPGSGADLQLGLATAPVLFALEEHDELRPLVARRFKREGDVEKARDLVLRSQALPRTRQLAQQYVAKAKEAISLLPHSEARDALEALSDRVVSRSR
ncbi:coq1 putative hexaprenyl diphosphate synthase [Tulasnella sp. 418]|nr:coq1 putative hexaprenyl diphosphate synthase [Tulasnella sp. 418]